MVSESLPNLNPMLHFELISHSFLAVSVKVSVVFGTPEEREIVAPSHHFFRYSNVQNLYVIDVIARES